jgi:hypothetical protein
LESLNQEKINLFSLYIYIYHKMSWCRARDDGCAYRKQVSQSTAPINYTLDPNKFYNCNECRPDLGLMGGNNVSITQNNMVDLESDLFGITRQNSKCPERKYLPHCHKCDEISGIPCEGCRGEQLSHLPECNIIQYAPRIDHVGYNVAYPPCNVQHPDMVYPPQLNPIRFN